MTPKKFPLKKTLVASAVAVAVFLVIYHYAFKSQPAPNLATATRGEIIQEVSVTGNVKPAQSVDLAFETSGKISGVYADVGDRVRTGQTLAQLDISELSAQLNKALADLTAQKSDLDKARVVLSNYYDGVIDVLNDAYTKANDAVRNQTDNMFADDETNPQLTFITANSQDKTNAETQRLSMSKNLNEWVVKLNQLNQSSSSDALENGLADAKAKLTTMRNFLDLLMTTAVNAANISPSTINTYRNNLITARAGANTALANVNDQQQNITAQKATITSDEAGIKSYEANIENIQAQIQKAAIYAPIDGVVTKQDAKVGEIAAANSYLVSVISASKLEVEANIPEADIAKVKIGNPAKITLDAYGNDVIFNANVTSIDPAETIIEGVATYKTKFQFTKEDARPKSGMTANIDILTNKHKNALILPQRAVTTKNGGKFVLVYKGQSGQEEREVKTGLRGSDGNIEIVDGLSEGEKVIIPAIQ